MNRSCWMVIPALAFLLIPVAGHTAEEAGTVNESVATAVAAAEAEAAVEQTESQVDQGSDGKILMLNKTEAQKTIVGKWKLDTQKIKEAMLAEINTQSGEDVEAAMAVAMVEAMVEQMKMTFEFKGDGMILTTQSMGGEEAKTETNKWNIVSVDKGKITMEVDKEAAYVTFVGKDILEIAPTEADADSMPPGMSSLRFNRIKD